MTANFLSRHVEESSFSIMKSIKSSGLNYLIQDTPFSTYVTIRKSMIKSGQKSSSSNHLESLSISEKISQKDSLESRCKYLEIANEAFNLKYSELVNNREDLKRELDQTKSELYNVENNLEVKTLELENSNETVQTLEDRS